MTSHSNDNQGYTLIEILIVMLIISIVSGIVLLTISKPSYQTLRFFKEDFIQTISLAKEEAILQPAVLMMELSNNSLKFFRYMGTAEDGNAWMPLNSRFLTNKVIPSTIVVRLDNLSQHSSMEDEGAPRIIFSTNGSVTPFKLYIGRIGEKPVYLISSDEAGNLTTKELS